MFFPKIISICFTLIYLTELVNSLEPPNVSSPSSNQTGTPKTFTGGRVSDITTGGRVSDITTGGRGIPKIAKVSEDKHKQPGQGSTPPKPTLPSTPVSQSYTKLNNSGTGNNTKSSTVSTNSKSTNGNSKQTSGFGTEKLDKINTDQSTGITSTPTTIGSNSTSSGQSDSLPKIEQNPPKSTKPTTISSIPTTPSIPVSYTKDQNKQPRHGSTSAKPTNVASQGNISISGHGSDKKQLQLKSQDSKQSDTPVSTTQKTGNSSTPTKPSNQDNTPRDAPEPDTRINDENFQESKKPKENSKKLKEHNEINQQPKKQEKIEPTELNIKNKEKADHCNYSYDKNSKTATFEAKQGYGFNLVKQDKTEIWKTNDVTKYATKVMTEGEGPNSKNVSLYLANNTFKNYTKSGKNWNERSNLLELNIKDTKSTYDYDYSKDEQTKTNTYTTKHGYGFSCVKEKKTEIWKTTNNEEYSNKVEIKLDGSKDKYLLIYYKNGNKKEFIKLGDKWFETPISVELDIKKTSSTDEYDYSKNEQTNTNTYTTKFGVEFNVVKYDKAEIWKTTNKSEYCLKVELNDLGDNKLDLTLYPINNTRKTFHKPGKKDPWSETTKLKVAILTLVGNDGKTNINDSSQFNMKEDPNGLYKCTFTDGSKCVEFKHNDKTVWKHKSEEFGNHYLTEVIFNFEEVTAKIMNLIIKSIYKDNEWCFVSKTPFEPSTNKLFTLVTSDNDDGLDNHENYYLHYDVLSHSGDRFMFFFKDGAKLLELKYDNTSVWKYDKDIYGDLYPESLIHKPGDFLCLSFDLSYYIYKFNFDKDVWVLNSNLSHKSSIPLHVSEHPSFITIITEDNNKQTQHNDTTEYKVYSHSDGLYLYALKEDSKCVEVKYNNCSIWRLNGPRLQNNLPITISVDTHEAVFEIEFKDKTLGFKSTEEGIMSYTVKNDKTQTKGLSLGFGKDSGSGGLTSRKPINTQGNPTLPTINSSGSSHKKPPPPPLVSQESNSSYKPPPPPPQSPQTSVSTVSRTSATQLPPPIPSLSKPSKPSTISSIPLSQTPKSTSGIPTSNQGFDDTSIAKPNNSGRIDINDSSKSLKGSTKPPTTLSGSSISSKTTTTQPKDTKTNIDQFSGAQTQGSSSFKTKSITLTLAQTDTILTKLTGSSETSKPNPKLNNSGTGNNTKSSIVSTNSKSTNGNSTQTSLTRTGTQPKRQTIAIPVK